MMAANNRWRFILLLGILAVAGAGGAARAGTVSDHAAIAEGLLTEGKAPEALAAFDKATAAFWDAMPLELRTVVFATEVSGFAQYTPRTPGPFRSGEPALIYLEPVGYAFTPEGDQFKMALAVDISIQTPGGLVLAKADDFMRLAWTGREQSREIHATIKVVMPTLKPGQYQLILGLRDQGSNKSTSVKLPITIGE
jgi:hypothetical protein